MTFAPSKFRYGEVVAVTTNNKATYAYHTNVTSVSSAYPRAVAIERIVNTDESARVHLDASEVSALVICIRGAFFPDRTPSPHFSAGVAKLQQFARYERDWNGRNGEPPSTMASAIARQALERIRAHGLDAERVAALPEGGVAIYCFSVERIKGGAHAKYARLSIPNHDTVCLTLADRAAERAEVVPVRTDSAGWADTVERISSFLGR